MSTDSLLGDIQFAWSTWGLTPGQYEAKLKRERLLRKAHEREQARYERERLAREFEQQRIHAKWHKRAEKERLEAEVKLLKQRAKAQHKAERTIAEEMRKAGVRMVPASASYEVGYQSAAIQQVPGCYANGSTREKADSVPATEQSHTREKKARIHVEMRIPWTRMGFRKTFSW